MNKSHGSGQGTEIVYCVEARSSNTRAEEANGMLLDNRWQPVVTVKAPIGVRSRVFSAEAEKHGFVNYGAALALAHWFLANGGYCTEVRIVKVKMVYSFNTEEVGVSEGMSHWHAERDAPFSERIVEPQSADAVDHHAPDPGTPTPRV